MLIRFVVGGITALVLAGCGSPAKPAADASSSVPSDTSSSTSTDTSSSTAVAAAPAKGQKPDKAFLIGKWGTDGDCTMAIDLRPDGTSDGPFGNWSYTDGAISFADEPQFKVNVTIIDDKTMASTSDGGKDATMTRCP